MEGGEIQNFIKVWVTVFASLCYCYTISKIAPKGVARLFTILPILCLFLALPLNLTSIHLGSITAFFIAWLANFKLLLFAFGKGPLSSEPAISLLRFVAVGCLPIKIIQQHPSPKIDPNPPQIDGEVGQNEHHPCLKPTKNGPKSYINYTIKILILAMMLRVYAYGEYIHPTVIWTLYCVHVYFCLDIVLAMVAAMARALLGLELEPQFNEPYLSTSLHDFWGRRWNVMVTSILRSTVYEPVLHLSTSLLGRKWAPLPAVLSTFAVSGLMHDLIFFYLGRVKPTWEITWFFLLNGVCLMAEIAVKKKINGRLRLPPVISGFMTVGFVTVAGLWFFVPQLLRCKADERAVEEYAALGAFVKDVGGAFTFKSFKAAKII